MYNFQYTATYESIDDAITDQLVGLTETELEQRYDDDIDTWYWEIDCKFATYSASYLMRTMDETMYRCWFADYTSEAYRYIDGLYYHEDDAQDIEDQCELVEETTEKDPE